jgi:hypothetical protein
MNTGIVGIQITCNQQYLFAEYPSLAMQTRTQVGELAVRRVRGLRGVMELDRLVIY